MRRPSRSPLLQIDGFPRLWGRCRFVAVLAVALALSLSTIASQTLAAPASLSGIDKASLQLFANNVEGDYICTMTMLARNPSRCPPYGPGARAMRLSFLRAQLPDPLPELAVEELEPPEGAITPYAFAYVRPLPAPTYGHPEEAVAGLPPLRQFTAGDNWVSVVGSAEYNGETWYEINTGEFIRGAHIAFTNPSSFRGVVLSEQPQYPFAWLNRDTRPASVPGGVERVDIVLRRYDRVTLYAQEPMGEQLWYMVGPDQWIEQSATARVDVDPPPEGVEPGEKWLEINTFEQTIAAYEGERMVFATLISSGRTGTWTPNGLTRIWGKYTSTPMQNRDVASDSPLWYYLEDVEWTQYFNGAYALHAAYWHNSFGFTRSHGCVNLSILDAKWLYQWTAPYAGVDSHVVYSHTADPGTWVYVHMTPPAPNVFAAQ
ncbi:MAG: L,D-transpeptidase [Anaerolineae bacterium]|nr:L,D-transpeptidase [Anaerolineae bacterium]